MQRYIIALSLIIVYSCGEPWESVLFPEEDVIEVVLIDTIAPTIGGIQVHKPYAINDAEISVWAQDDIDIDRVIFFVNDEKRAVQYGSGNQPETYTFLWTGSANLTGQYKLGAMAIDKSNNYAETESTVRIEDLR